MLGCASARAFDLFFLGASEPQKGRGRQVSMRSTVHVFSEETLTELLRALRARTAGHPENPGLVASWPGVPEALMSAACGELLARGHPIFRIAIPGRSADGWAIRSGTEEPTCRA
jgi:hypothetical protein